MQTTVEVLDSKVPSGVKKIINGDVKRRVFVEEEAAQKDRNAFSREGKSHGVVYDSFKVSGTDESVLDLNEIVKVELKNDNVLSSQYAMG